MAVSLIRRIAIGVMAGYMRGWHRATVDGAENLPPRGPALVLFNHASLLDIPTLVLVDKYPDTAVVAKASLFRVPILSWIISMWNLIPVERQGRDLASVRAILTVLRSGGIVAAAPEGRRSRSGHMEPMNPVLVRIARSADVPIIPIGIVGSFQALPPGAWIPKPIAISVRIGTPFSLSRGMSDAAAADRISQAIADLLPPAQRPVTAALPVSGA